MFFQKKCFNKNRKIRANELEENFSYESKFNNDKNISKNKTIIKDDDEKKEKYYNI